MPQPGSPSDFGDFATMAERGGAQGIAAYFDATARRKLARQLKTFREQKGLTLEDIAPQMLTVTADEGHRPFNGHATVAKVAMAIKEFEQCLWFPSVPWVQRLAGTVGFRLGFTLSPRSDAADRQHFAAIQADLVEVTKK